MASETTQQQTPEFVYRSAWKRRLVLVLLGFALIALSKALYVWLCWREWTSPFSLPRNEIACVGALKTPVTSSTLAQIPNFPSDRLDKALLLACDSHQQWFRPVYDDPKEPGRSGGIADPPRIHRSLLDFTPSAVMAAYQRMKPDDLLVNDFAEGCSIEEWKTSSRGDFIILELWKDNAFGPHTKALTIYTQQDGQLSILVGSTQPVVQWMAKPRKNPEVLLIHYSNGMEGYRWRDRKFVPDPTVKKENFGDVVALSLVGMRNEAMAAGLLTAQLALILWCYRLIKFLAVWLFRLTYRPFHVLRGGTLGCALPLASLIGLFMTSFNSEFCGNLQWCAMIDLAGWVMILIAAAIPNRRVAVEAVPVTEIQAAR